MSLLFKKYVLSITISSKYRVKLIFSRGIYISELQLFGTIQSEKLKVDLDYFWLVNFITLYAFITPQKFPNTLLSIKRDTLCASHFLLNSGVKLVLYRENAWNMSLILHEELIHENTSQYTDLFSASFWIKRQPKRILSDRIQ
jgi:hypothetical protein